MKPVYIAVYIMPFLNIHREISVGLELNEVSSLRMFFEDILSHLQVKYFKILSGTEECILILDRYFCAFTCIIEFRICPSIFYLKRVAQNALTSC